MRRMLMALALVLVGSSPAWATWSVIALNARTGEVIIASATCVRQEGFPKRQPNPSRDLMDVQAVVVPGIGVAACQAGVDNTRRNQMLVYNELRKGTPPADIITMLQKDPRSSGGSSASWRSPTARRSPAATTAAGFNGSGNSRESLYFGGAVGPDIYYQVQGNTLLGTDVVYEAALAFTRTEGSMADPRDGGDGSGRCER